MTSDSNKDTETLSFLKNFLPDLKNFVHSETVFGEPYKLGEITLIPVQSVKAGFTYGADKKSMGTDAKKGGGAGGVSLSPVALIVIQDGHVSVRGLNASNLESILEKIPDFLEQTYSFSQKVLKSRKKND